MLAGEKTISGDVTYVAQDTQIVGAKKFAVPKIFDPAFCAAVNKREIKILEKAKIEKNDKKNKKMQSEGYLLGQQKTSFCKKKFRLWYTITIRQLTSPQMTSMFKKQLTIKNSWFIYSSWPEATHEADPPKQTSTQLTCPADPAWLACKTQLTTKKSWFTYSCWPEATHEADPPKPPSFPTQFTFPADADWLACAQLTFPADPVWPACTQLTFPADPNWLACAQLTFKQILSD